MGAVRRPNKLYAGLVIWEAVGGELASQRGLPLCFIHAV